MKKKKTRPSDIIKFLRNPWPNVKVMLKNLTQWEKDLSSGQGINSDKGIQIIEEYLPSTKKGGRNSTQNINLVKKITVIKNEPFQSLSELYDHEGKLIGRQYQDIGDVTLKAAKSFLDGWTSLTGPGRPKGPADPDFDGYIYDLIETREEWFEKEREERKVGIREAIRQWILGMNYVDKNEEGETSRKEENLLVDSLYKAYKRGEKEKRK